MTIWLVCLHATSVRLVWTYEELADEDWKAWTLIVIPRRASATPNLRWQSGGTKSGSLTQYQQSVHPQSSLRVVKWRKRTGGSICRKSRKMYDNWIIGFYGFFCRQCRLRCSRKRFETLPKVSGLLRLTTCSSR